VRNKMKRLTLLLPLLLLAGCSKQLETGLTERDAQEIIVTLRRHGIDASAEAEAGDGKKAPTWQVKVRGTSDNVVEAWNILHQSGLPHTQDQGLQQVFANSGMIPTATEEKARLLVGLSGELAGVLKSVADVVDAHVQVVLPDNSPLLDKNQQTPPTASVLFSYRSPRPPLTELEVKSIVAKAVEGLQADNVSVVMKHEEQTPIPPRVYGPLLASEWTVMAALTVAAMSVLVSIFLVVVNRRRKATIRRLERQFADRGLSVGSTRQAAEA
jgi:type III secretion protein J